MSVKEENDCTTYPYFGNSGVCDYQNNNSNNNNNNNNFMTYCRGYSTSFVNHIQQQQQHHHRHNNHYQYQQQQQPQHQQQQNIYPCNSYYAYNFDDCCCIDGHSSQRRQHYRSNNHQQLNPLSECDISSYNYYQPDSMDASTPTTNTCAIGSINNNNNHYYMRKFVSGNHDNNSYIKSERNIGLSNNNNWTSQRSSMETGNNLSSSSSDSLNALQNLTVTAGQLGHQHNLRLPVASGSLTPMSNASSSSSGPTITRPNSMHRVTLSAGNADMYRSPVAAISGVNSQSSAVSAFSSASPMIPGVGAGIIINAEQNHNNMVVPTQHLTVSPTSVAIPTSGTRFSTGYPATITNRNIPYVTGPSIASINTPPGSMLIPHHTVRHPPTIAQVGGVNISGANVSTGLMSSTGNNNIVGMSSLSNCSMSNHATAANVAGSHVHRPTSKPASSSSSSSNSVVVTDEEAKKVREEVRRLREKYLGSLRLALERVQQRNSSSDNEVKVWSVLRNILEDPSSINKPLALKHIPKIEQHLMKAEEHLYASGEISKTAFVRLPHSSSSRDHTGGLTATVKTEMQQRDSGATSGGAKLTGLSDLSKHNVEMGTEGNISCAATAVGMPGGSLHSLDSAFHNVCGQLSTAATTNKRSIRAVHQNLIEHVKVKQPKYCHHLPKIAPNIQMSLEGQDSSSSSSSIKNTDIHDPKEFDVLDSVELNFEGVNTNNLTSNGAYKLFPMLSIGANWWDEEGLIRTDIDFDTNFECLDFKTESVRLEKEFELVEINNNDIDSGQDETINTKLNSSISEEKYKDVYSYDWSSIPNKNSRIFRLAYQNKLSDHDDEMKEDYSIIIKVPDDYDDAGIVAWKVQYNNSQSEKRNNLNVILYKILKENFLSHSQARIWDGLCLSHVACLLKLSVNTAVKGYGNQSQEV